MTTKPSQFKLNHFQTERFKINKLVNDTISINYELDIQDYFKNSKIESINRANKTHHSVNKFRVYETEWELINGDEEIQEFVSGVFFAYKGYHVELGDIPEVFIDFIDVKILWRNSGSNDEYVPIASQDYFFEVTNTADDRIKKTTLHASIYFSEDTRFSQYANQTEATNTSIDTKLLVTFTYPYNIY